MTHSTIIIGAGAWGKALAYTCHKANPQSQITLVTKTDTQPHNMPKKISDIEQIKIAKGLDNQIHKKSPIIIATPSSAIAHLLARLKKLEHQGDILCTAKGFIDGNSVLYPHELYQQINPKATSFSYLYGPTFADEVLLDQPTQAVLACSSKKSKNLWQNTLQNNEFQTIVSSDLKGLAWCSVFKNIVAIISGCMRACHFGQNAQALLITHATIELNSIIKLIKGNPQTACSLAGIGDIVLSASSDKSRNFRYGQSIVNNKVTPKTLIEGKLNLELMHKKLNVMKKVKPTILTLAEKCIADPAHCKQAIIAWLQKKANYLHKGIGPIAN